jgi:menaquinone-dependent protoporphyrinogen oxidase
MKILVAYDSAHGSTQSIAERIEERIRQGNVGDTTLSAITKTTSAEDFDVLIIGSAIHFQGWLKQSSAFVKRSQGYLHDNPKPTWAFSVGMPPDSGVAGEEKVMEKWLRKYVTLRGHKLFQGEYKEKDLNGCFKFLLVRCFGQKFEDKRKWDQIDEWADSIVQKLRVDLQTQAGN